jgi:hypothetical protein
MNGDATLNIYPFRRLNGPFEEQFRRTRLRELLVQDSQEAQLAGPVEIQKLAVPGAEAALFARFTENRFGTTRYRLRLGVYSAGAVALVDYNANGPDAYQRNWPAVAAVLDSLKVGAPEPTTASKPTPTGGASGLYMASTRRFVMRIGGPPGSGDWEIATRFYLLSADGRFHRGYGLPSVPGGDVRAFDYAKAEREDAANTGTYTQRRSLGATQPHRRHRRRHGRRRRARDRQHDIQEGRAQVVSRLCWLRALVALDDGDIHSRNGQTYFPRLLIRRRFPARERGFIARKFDDRMACAACSVCIFEAPCAC